MAVFKKPKMRFLDGYTESPLAHYEEATQEDREDEYFMQSVLPIKLNRISQRTALGYRLTYLYGKDVWNNGVGIKIPEDLDTSHEINNALYKILKRKDFYNQSTLMTGFDIEQGEAVVLLYWDDVTDIAGLEHPVKQGAKLIRYEAVNKLNYYIPKYNKYGDAIMYNIIVGGEGGMGIEMSTPVHPTRVIRKVSDKIDWRFEGYSRMAPLYDLIVILSTIIKASGEAAFRWGTGHPTIFTKNVYHDSDLDKLKTAIGDPTRRSWHMLPMEYVDRFEMLGQAGSMLNLKSLADLVIDQVVAGCGIPRPILMGDTPGVLKTGEVVERSYFARLDLDHTDLEGYVREVFERDPDVKELLRNVKYWEPDWGIRNVFNKMDEIEYRQKEISNALALTQIITVNEARKLLGFSDISDEEGGDIILGLETYYAMEQQEYMDMTSSTERQVTSDKTDLEKNKQNMKPNSEKLKSAKGKISDAFKDWLRDSSRNEISRKLEIYPKTLSKILDNLDKDEDDEMSEMSEES